MLCERHHSGVADFNNVSPFFLYESFPPNWYRRAIPLTAAELVALILQEHALAPSTLELGTNQQTTPGNFTFVPLDSSVSSMSGPQLGCFLLENILALTAGQFSSTTVNNIQIFEAFVAGVLAPFFFNDGYFNCGFTSFAQPGVSAGVGPNGVSSSG